MKLKVFNIKYKVTLSICNECIDHYSHLIKDKKIFNKMVDNNNQNLMPNNIRRWSLYEI